MKTRQTTTSTGSATHDAGRVDSERVMERGNTTKWLDGMKADSVQEAATAMTSLHLIKEKTPRRSEASTSEAMDVINAAQLFLGQQKKALDDIKELLKRNESAQQMGARIIAENEFAKGYLTEEKQKLLKDSEKTSIWSKAHAESAALEMAKGTFK